MAIGLVVDAIAHVAHAACRQSGNPNERVKKALEEVGSPVGLGCVTTTLGVMSLNLAQSQVGGGS